MNDWLSRKMCALRMILKAVRRLPTFEQHMLEFSENFYYEIGALNAEIPNVLTPERTLEKVIRERLSVARFGDGEFDMAVGAKMSFQKYDNHLSQRLCEILANPQEKCLCCLPRVFGSLSAYTDDEQRFWRIIMCRRRKQIMPLLGSGYSLFGDSFISRPYMRMRDKNLSRRIFELWKTLVKDMDLLIVEGRFSRLGIGNDLFGCSRSIRRIWCPPIDAFDYYDKIQEAVRKHAKKDDLILLALGATATVFAYDLSKDGYWVIDAGHIDIEYMWMLMGACEKCAISGRYMVEVDEGKEMKPIEGELEENNVLEVVE